jgi:hypothetical protein
VAQDRIDFAAAQSNNDIAREFGFVPPNLTAFSTLTFRRRYPAGVALEWHHYDPALILRTDLGSFCQILLQRAEAERKLNIVDRHCNHNV